ncbi:hypothetical protein DFH09DRAFT_1281488 [Mycena vulgaris]|nr:hypothetical protein DFH09DRAFT_1281488 [Mycena vulgaris]
MGVHGGKARSVDAGVSVQRVGGVSGVVMGRANERGEGKDCSGQFRLTTQLGFPTAHRTNAGASSTHAHPRAPGTHIPRLASRNIARTLVRSRKRFHRPRRQSEQRCPGGITPGSRKCPVHKRITAHAKGLANLEAIPKMEIDSRPEREEEDKSPIDSARPEHTPRRRSRQYSRGTTAPLRARRARPAGRVEVALRRRGAEVRFVRVRVGVRAGGVALRGAVSAAAVGSGGEGRSDARKGRYRWARGRRLWGFVSGWAGEQLGARTRDELLRRERRERRSGACVCLLTSGDDVSVSESGKGQALGDAHEDYLDVDIERHARRAIEEAAAKEGRGRESGLGHCERTPERAGLTATTRWRGSGLGRRSGAA